MNIVRLNGITYGAIASIVDCIVPVTATGVTRGNRCYVIMEPNEFGSDPRFPKMAFRVECKSVKIGYIPEVSKLNEWIEEAERVGNIEKHAELSIWAEAVETARNQFKIDYDNNGVERWPAIIYNLKWIKNKQWRFFNQMKHDDIANPASGWKLLLVSIGFED